MRMINSFRGVVIYAAILSVICALLGIIISILASTPVGATIVAIDIVAYFINWVLSVILKRD